MYLVTGVLLGFVLALFLAQSLYSAPDQPALAEVWVDADGDGVFGTAGDAKVAEGPIGAGGEFALEVANAPTFAGSRSAIIVNLPPAWGPEGPDNCVTIGGRIDLPEVSTAP